MVMPVTSRTRAKPILLALAFCASAAGCYSATFDENQGEVYYCASDSDCLASQACAQFQCVADDGPSLRLSLPEPLTLVQDSTLTVDFEPTDFTVSESNESIDGQGKVAISIDGGVIEQTVVTVGTLLDIAGLAAGGHHITITAVHGDGTPYTNPSASDYTTFFLESDNPARPQVAFSFPPPGHVHVIGEPLQIRVAVRNFTLVDAGSDCKVPTDCDPFDPGSPDCIPNCQATPPVGHTHIYLEDDYPGCLLDTPIGCNGDYVLSMRTADVNASGNEVVGEVEAKFFDTPGKKLLSVGLQYNDHDPFPAPSFVIHQSIEITVVDR